MYDELVAKLRIGEEVFPGYVLYGYSKEPYRLSPEDLKQAADAIEELQTYADLYKDMTEESQRVARKVIDSYPKWIPVTERLPENHDDYLVYIIGGEYDQISWTQIAFFDSRYFHLTGVGVIARVTHWAYLPEPPKEET